MSGKDRPPAEKRKPSKTVSAKPINGPVSMPASISSMLGIGATLTYF
jgi:hypothetical protein